MHPIATNRASLLQVVEGTVAAFQARDSSRLVASLSATAPLGPADGEAQRDSVISALENAARTLRLHDDLAAVASMQLNAAAVRDRPFIPEDQVLSLVQSAIDEYMPEESLTTAAPFDPFDPGWLSVAWEKLKGFFRGKHPFIEHTTLDSFQIALPENAVVALFSDWGTGTDSAKRVMREIARQNPTHAIHLGDVYYSGTEREIRTRFLEIIDAHGPSSSHCTYLALNSNHEMYSGGHAYFEVTLKERFNQEASYFNLRNAHWQLIGLDSGYEDHGLKDPQREWLTAQLEAPGLKNILLTHHQFFSPYESRARDRKLHRKVAPLLGGVFGWFWGHEHKPIVFGKHLGIHARCIGHGAIPEDVPFGTPSFTEVPILHTDERTGPGGDNMHGFAVLRFNGAHLHVDYVDELGATWFSEDLA